jgi:hypothetical protein
MSSLLITRTTKLIEFINQFFAPEEVKTEPILGDAGLRNYYRVASKYKTYILMDCPPSYCSVQPFIDMAIFLKENKFSAPEIFHQDVKNGFLLLEDFGTINLKNYILSNKELSKDSYLLMIDLLVALQKKPLPTKLPQATNEDLITELKIFVDWYVPHTYKKELSKKQLEEFLSIWRNILKQKTVNQPSLVLRDYHVENIMYLEKEKSIRKLGLLDFQDALIGSPIYDLVSLLEDARIDVSRKDALSYVEYFAQKKNFDVESVLVDYHILGAQRNCRILGVFARKAMRDHDDGYLQYIPRVLKYLKYDLSHSVLAPLKEWFKKLDEI